MKQEEWERRIELNLHGVRLLGAALVLQADQERAYFERRLNDARREGDEIFGFDPPFELESYERDFDARNQRYARFVTLCQDLLTPIDDYKRAAGLRVMDFRFRWEHFRDHLILVGFSTDEVPDFALPWEREKPICEYWSGDYVTCALAQIFEAEYERLLGPDPETLPELCAREDFLFYLTVWKHCEPERGRGRPAERPWRDGLYYAASHAFSIRKKAEERGTPISIAEAIRRALEDFVIVTPAEFENHPDKESTVVTASGTPGDRTVGAIKAVRKKLAEIDKSEPEQ